MIINTLSIIKKNGYKKSHSSWYKRIQNGIENHDFEVYKFEIERFLKQDDTKKASLSTCLCGLDGTRKKLLYHWLSATYDSIYFRVFTRVQKIKRFDAVEWYKK